MGLKDVFLDRQREYGFTTFGDKCVCGDCISEEFLQKYIEENALSMYCDYCGREEESFIAVDVDNVMEFIIGNLRYEWGHPDDEGVGYDSREGGYLGVEIYDGWDFVGEILAEEAEIDNDRLLSEIRDALMDTMWCEIDPYGLSQDKEMFFSWQSFSNKVKHETRYVFNSGISSNSKNYTTDPSEIIDFIGANVEEIGLIKELPIHNMYRVRVSNKGEYFYSAKEIGPPPKENALTSNRMSPAGILMFYGGIDKETALLEVEYQTGENVVASIGEFSNSRTLTVLDLTSLSKIPSIFDEIQKSNRWLIKFFYSFLDDFSKPIKKDGKEHIDYVPTQIVTEYFRHNFLTNNNDSLDGIVYPSSKNGRNSYVLFFENKDFGDISSDFEMILTNVYHKID